MVHSLILYLMRDLQKYILKNIYYSTHCFDRVSEAAGNFKARAENLIKLQMTHCGDCLSFLTLGGGRVSDVELLHMKWFS